MSLYSDDYAPLSDGEGLNKNSLYGRNAGNPLSDGEGLNDEGLNDYSLHGYNANNPLFRTKNYKPVVAVAASAGVLVGGTASYLLLNPKKTVMTENGLKNTTVTEKMITDAEKILNNDLENIGSNNVALNSKNLGTKLMDKEGKIATEIIEESSKKTKSVNTFKSAIDKKADSILGKDTSTNIPINVPTNAPPIISGATDIGGKINTSAESDYQNLIVNAGIFIVSIALIYEILKK